MSFLPPAKMDFMEDWSVLGSPRFLIILFVFYFTIIKLASVFMKNRPPFDLTIIIRVYNLYQVVTCIAIAAYINFRLGYETFSSTWKCKRFEDENFSREDLIKFFNAHWCFMVFRSTELLETIFFILRGKQNQVSVLHVYHHVSTLFWYFWMNRYSACYMDLYIGSLNNYVHILMYTYYFFSSFKALRGTVAKLKPLMTTIQMTQLVLIFGHCIVAIFCRESLFYYLFALNAAILLVLFTNFYYKNYLKKKKHEKIV